MAVVIKVGVPLQPFLLKKFPPPLDKSEKGMYNNIAVQM